MDNRGLTGGRGLAERSEAVLRLNVAVHRCEEVLMPWARGLAVFALSQITLFLRLPDPLCVSHLLHMSR